MYYITNFIFRDYYNIPSNARCCSIHHYVYAAFIISKFNIVVDMSLCQRPPSILGYPYRLKKMEGAYIQIKHKIFIFIEI